MPGTDDNVDKPKGRGWHGDSAGHARAGRLGGQKSGGNFKRDRKKASLAGRKRAQRQSE